MGPVQRPPGARQARCERPRHACPAPATAPSLPAPFHNDVCAWAAGYLFNINFLKNVFAPTFVLHDVRRTGPLELTTR